MEKEIKSHSQIMLNGSFCNLCTLAAGLAFHIFVTQCWRAPIRAPIWLLLSFSHFLIRIFPSAFCHPHFTIRIRYPPPSGPHAVYRDPPRWRWRWFETIELWWRWFKTMELWWRWFYYLKAGVHMKAGWLLWSYRKYLVYVSSNQAPSYPASSFLWPALVSSSQHAQ